MIRKAARSIAKRLGCRAEISRRLSQSPQASSEYRALGDRVFNKAGRMVLTGEYQGEKVKIYEAANPTHAEFIEWVSNESEVRDIFPEIRRRRGAILYAEWVTGESFNPNSPDPSTKEWLDKLLELEICLRRFKMPVGINTGFDYWNEYILPRFERFAVLFKAEDLVPQIQNRIRIANETGPLCLENPDITHRNVIISTDNFLRLIDNDLLTAKTISLAGICNAIYALPGQLRQPYWESFLHKSDVKITSEMISALEAFWVARLTGSLGVANRFTEARHLLDQFRNTESVLPFSPEYSNRREE